MAHLLSAGILACFTPTPAVNEGAKIRSRSELAKNVTHQGQFTTAVFVTAPKMAVKVIGEGRFSAKASN